MGCQNKLVEPHKLYQRLGLTLHERQLAYRKLFNEQINNTMLQHIRDATNSDAILGSERFKEEIASMLHRRVTRLTHGGDRRSEVFHEERN